MSLSIKDITAETPFKQLTLEDFFDKEMDADISLLESSTKNTNSKEKDEVVSVSTSNQGTNKAEITEVHDMGPFTPIETVKNKISSEEVSGIINDVISDEDLKNLTKTKRIKRNAELLAAYKNGDCNAIAQFIHENEKLIHSVCQKLQWKKYASVEYDDAYNIVVLAMLDGISTLFESRNMTSSADFYKLYLTMISESKRQLAEKYPDSTVRMPYSTQKYKMRMNKEINELQSVSGSGGDENGTDDVFSKINYSEDELTPEDITIQKMQFQKLKECIKLLDPIEQEIISQRFGLGGEDKEERKFKTIAENLGIPQSKIHYLQKKALKELKLMMSM